MGTDAKHAAKSKVVSLGIFATMVLWLVFPMVAAVQEPEPALVGDFAVTIAEEDVPQDLANRAAWIGRWKIRFAPGGSYEIGRQDVGVVASGRYGVDGDVVVLTEESGLLACGPSADGRPARAVYEWGLVDGRLRLVAAEDACVGRRLLLTTRTLSAFVSCPPRPTVGGASEASAGAAVSASPTALAAAVLPATPAGEQAPAAEAAIDSLLAQMTACWATGEPARFLPLLSARHRESLVSDEGDLRRLLLAMGASFVWERADALEVVADDRVAAVVRQTSGDEEDFVRYAFVREGGAWKWDGPVEEN